MEAMLYAVDRTTMYSFILQRFTAHGGDVVRRRPDYYVIHYLAEDYSVWRRCCTP
jgi:hypothetical protein